MTRTDQSPHTASCSAVHVEDCRSRSGLEFPRAYRLSRKAEFDRLLKSPDRRMNRGALRVYVRRNEMSHARLGVVVGRRWSPRAVDRNRVKRLVRESFRLHAGRLGSVDVIVQLVAATTGNEAKDLDALWQRLGDESGDAARR